MRHSPVHLDAPHDRRSLDLERAENLCDASRGMVTAANYRIHAEAQRCRPFVVLGASIGRVGGRWLAEYFGVQGFGDTPELAAHDFDLKWQGINNDENQL